MRLLSVLVLLVTIQAAPALAIGMCGSGKRVTCVVDGDTIWLRGEKIRLQGFDAPETTTNICGGNQEVNLGKQATRRLVEIMNSGNMAIRRSGKDRYGRTLAVLTSKGVNVGDILIAEGLARRWPDGIEFWCE